MEYAIGIDIGGTNTKIGAVLKDGKVVAENRFSTTDASDYNSYMSLLVKAIKIPRQQNYTYGFLYIVYLFTILPTNSSLATRPIFLAIALYVLYLGEKESYEALECE